MDHIGRIGLALAYIESHLKEDIDLEELARTANSSLYWFHKIFASVVAPHCIM
jgi:transcriptional regulator GlxA family with amidase domain